MRKVFVTWPLPEGPLVRLAEHAKVVVNPDPRVLTRAELISGAAGAFGILTTLRDVVDDAVLEASGVKIVANCAVGYDNIDVRAAAARQVFVTNTPDVLTETTADLAFGLLLAVARRIGEGERFVRVGAHRGWHPGLMLGTDVFGKTLGIVGLGRIGRAVARRARGFGMRVVYHGGRPVEPGPQPLPLDDLLAVADFVSLHVPLNAATRGMIGRRELSLMRPTSFLINTARGEVVDLEALVESLTLGQIGGAGLDVFHGSPEHVDERFFDMEHVVMTPHIGSATHETRARMADLAVDNLLCVLSSRRPPNLVTADPL